MTTMIGLLPILVGTALILFAVRNSRRAQASLAWPSVPGRITSSEVITISGRNEDTHTPRVHYEYTVGGRTYTGRRIAFGGIRSFSQNAAMLLVEKFKPGTQAEVFYDPAAPDDAVLERRTGSSSLLLWAPGVLFILVGLVAVMLTRT